MGPSFDLLTSANGVAVQNGAGTITGDFYAVQFVGSSNTVVTAITEDGVAANASADTYTPGQAIYNGRGITSITISSGHIRCPKRAS